MKAEVDISSGDDYLSSEAICSHLNQKYSSWIHIIALHHYQTRYRLTPNIVIENAKIAGISSRATYYLSYTYCNGEICSKENVIFDFIPRIVGANESR